MIPAIGGSALPRIDVGAADMQPAIGRSSAAASAAAGPDFSAVMAQVATDAVDTLKSAETVSVQGLKGQASTQAVVDAVMNAERTLQTAVTIRDKVVSAYLELSRMAI